MKKLNFSQMEVLNGGVAELSHQGDFLMIDADGNVWQCVGGVVGMAVTIGAITAVTGPVGGWAAASFIFGYATSAWNIGAGCGRALSRL